MAMNLAIGNDLKIKKKKKKNIRKQKRVKIKIKNLMVYSTITGEKGV